MECVNPFIFSSIPHPSILLVVATDMTAQKSNDPRDVKARAIIESTLKQVPMKRMGEPEDVANLASFLVSRNSDCEFYPVPVRFRPWLIVDLARHYGPVHARWRWDAYAIVHPLSLSGDLNMNPFRGRFERTRAPGLFRMSAIPRPRSR